MAVSDGVTAPDEDQPQVQAPLDTIAAPPVAGACTPQYATTVMRAAPAGTLPTIVIGTGPVGIRTAREVLERGAADAAGVWLFGDEPVAPYNRVVLSCYLAGETDDIDLTLPSDPRLVTQFGVRIIAIDRTAATVTDSLGCVHPYERLVLATGSRPRIPAIPGVDLPGVFTFRDLADAERLKARTARARAVTVIGGGILGLETARALHVAGTRVRVIDHNAHVMFSQLDAAAGELLGAFVADQGIEVIAGDRVQQIIGVGQVTGVQLHSGRLIDCDTVVIAAGIVPNVQLARDAGLGVAHGVRVDDGMHTSDPRIFAVGECAEHRGVVYGLVAPGLEQAAVAGHNIVAARTHRVEARYPGSVTTARLKVVGCEVFSAGDVQESEVNRPHALHRDVDQGIYRKLMLAGNRLIGAIAIGPWHESNRLQEAIVARRRLWPWEVSRFQRTGVLWSTLEEQSIFDWPANAAVCNCTGVSLAQLRTALAQGATSQSLLSARTSAGTVCGSCRPLLAELAGAHAPDPVPAAGGLATFSVLSLLLGVAIFLLPGLPLNASVQDALRWDVLWRESLWKQVTGFSLLGLAAAVSVLGLRKRLPAFTLGRFDGWRLVHVLLGALAVAVLLAHTGMRLGSNLNLWLMASFTGLLVAGGIGGAVIALEHRLPRPVARRSRNTAVWAHVLLVWPLPVLLGFHILKGYWY
ncbi:FAD-dependent oxidoreductase [uncultured Thiohalocapsa sp.]|uniref:FAD-dependent oxidoreductase n=1 Tax=uncultured Thiohalocapsa sp. TaxID=768990 RepID=UPI0025ED553F|nr:FAD-dependent oxidoreductase [uncultured Thiohalocapsa sp.]